MLGASITAVELPTAFPYFAAIAAILGAGLGPVRDLVLLLVFNLCFVLPLVAIVATLTFAPDRPNACSPPAGASSSATGRRCSPGSRSWPARSSWRWA